MAASPSSMPERARTVGPGTGGGLVTFAAVLLILLAFFNGLDGLAAAFRSHVFIGNAHYVFGDLRAWGWLMFGLAVLQGMAAAGILAGAQWARWFGVVVLGLNAFGQMFFIPSYPFWSVLIIAIDIVAIYGLTAYGGRPIERVGSPPQSQGVQPEPPPDVPPHIR